MYRITFVLLALAIAVIITPVGFAQECGDANGDGTLNILDATSLIEYLAYPEATNGPEIFPSAADCDGNAGITMADVVTIFDFLFRGEDNLDCSASGTYSLAMSETDTVFIPFVNNVPAGVWTVELPIMASLADNSDGLNIPLLTGSDYTDDQFDLTNIYPYHEGQWIGAGMYPMDTDSCFLKAFEMVSGSMDGDRITYFGLNFTRYSNNVGSINPAEYIRSPLWRITVEKDGDLFIPVIVYYNVVLADPILSVDPTSLAFTARSGETSSQGYSISFTSTERPVTFDLDISASWLTLEGNPTGPFTTPVSFLVNADATGLFPGNHAATITPIGIDPGENVLVNGVVDIDFNVTTPPNLPWGDINCDGAVSISDIALIIDCVFINPRPIPDCR